MQMPKPLAEALVRFGLLASLTVRGRRSGVDRVTYVGPAVAPDGGLYVGAGDASRQWAGNLRVAKRCYLRSRGRGGWYSARELAGAERQRAVQGLQPRFGTANFSGPVFELRPEVESTVEPT